MGSYHAEIVNLSLKNKKMIKEYVILECRKRFWGLCKIYTIIIPERDIDDAVSMFQSNLSTALNKEWYITFHTAEKVIIVFREKVFRVSGKVNIEMLKQCHKELDGSNKLSAFLHYVQRYLFKVLNRRSHKKSYTWDGYIDMLKVYPLAKPKIYVKLF